MNGLYMHSVWQALVLALTLHSHRGLCKCSVIQGSELNPAPPPPPHADILGHCYSCVVVITCDHDGPDSPPAQHLESQTTWT